MIELRTLGGLQLRGPPAGDYRAVLAQPKRLAMLAYLALAHPGRFARRDTVVALFWPELDADHARSALRQTLSFLRRALGNDALLSGGCDAIAVNTSVVHCDAVAFDQACNGDDLQRAAELYQGDLLEGLYVSDAAPELEHWIEDERSRLRLRARQVVWQLAARREAEGNIPLAAEHARHAAALFPLDEAGLRRLILLLEKLGDYAGAVRHYETFNDRLAREFEVEPAAETAALMLRVRSRIGGAAVNGENGGVRVAHSNPVAPTRLDRPNDPTPAGPTRMDRPNVPTPSVEPAALPELRRAHPGWRRAAILLAAAITGLIGVAIGVQARQAPAPPMEETADPLAQELYIKARVAWGQHTFAGLNTAAEYLEEAVRRDPSFARAYGMLALSYVFMPYFGQVAPHDAYPRAQAAAHRALELNPALAEPTYAQAHLSASFLWDWNESDRLFRRALDLNPEDPIAHLLYGGFLSATGRLDAGLAEFEVARVLDPSSRWILNEFARRLIWAGQHDRAMTELRSALRLEPNFPRAHRTLGLLHVVQGRYAEAIDEFTKACVLGGNRPFDLSALAHGHVLLGERAEAERILADLEARQQREYVPPFAIATIHVSLGRTDDAFAWLDRAADARDPLLAWTVQYEPMLDPIRADARFEALRRRMRLPADRAAR